MNRELSLNLDSAPSHADHRDGRPRRTRMNSSELPAAGISIGQVLDVIRRTEARHHVVWTAGRVLKEEGLLHRIMTGDPGARKLILRQVRAILKTLVRDGVLAERGLQFNYGMSTEVSYDFVHQLPVKGTGL
jgi:hypothetical protein